MKVFPVGVNVVEDLAVDWIGGNLYWNDYVVETIEVAKLDGSMKTILFSENITNPRGIEVDPRSGYSTAFNNFCAIVHLYYTADQLLRENLARLPRALHINCSVSLFKMVNVV